MNIPLSKGIFISFCLIAFSFSSPAQEQRRTKVGLVLSGGGAKGMAHIGVIRALEENGIPIDYIAGTSAGAIVGGLYAAGYSTSEMEAIFIAPEFEQLLKDNTRNQGLFYFRANPPTPHWLEPSVKIDSFKIDFQFPTNILSPLQLDYEFMSIYSGANAVSKGNFDSLFIPFRCAATNLNEQRAHYFSRGNLGTSIRASMTFPFLFQPVIIDGIVFFDGGLYDNFPVSIVKKDFNPDVIIGSKVANNFPPPKKGDLVSYLQKMTTHITEYDLEGATGIILTPDLPLAMNITNFKGTCDLEKIGYNCALDAMDSIKAMVKDSIPESEIEKKRNLFRKKIPPLYIDTLIISGINNPQKKYVSHLIGNHKKQVISIDNIKENYFSLFSDANVQSVYPSLLFDTATQNYKLFLDIEVNDAVIPKIGGYLAVGASSEAFFELAYRRLENISSLYKINAYLGAFYNSICAYTRFDFPSNVPFYTTVDYTLNKWDHFNNALFRVEEPSFTYLTQYEQHLKFDIGLPFRKSDKIRFVSSFNREEDFYREANVIYKDDKPDKTTFNSFSTGFVIERSTLDKPQYASRGFYSKFMVMGLFGREYYRAGSFSILPNTEITKDHKWIQLYYNIQKYKRFSKFYKLGASLECAASWQNNFFNYPATLLHTNAFYSTVESRQYFMPEYRANFYAAPGLQNVFKIYQNIHFRAEGYVFLPFNKTILEYNNIDIESQTKLKDIITPYFIFSSGFVYHSPIGPISLLLNYHQRDYDANPFSVIFNIGYVFFNKRSYRE